MKHRPRFPGIRVTANGNQLVSYHTETRIADAGVFYPITPSTEGGELYQQAFAEGKLNVFGQNTIAVEAEGEHAAQGGAIAFSVCGKRVVNYTSGQGVVYGVEQYYHAPGKCRSEEHTSELQSQSNLVCRLLLEKKKKNIQHYNIK